jgi:hypothetical protein
VTRLFPDPSGHPLLDFFLGQRAALGNVAQSSIDRLAHVDPVLDVFERCVIRERVENMSNRVLGGLQLELLSTPLPQSADARKLAATISRPPERSGSAAGCAADRPLQPDVEPSRFAAAFLVTLHVF